MAYLNVDLLYFDNPQTQRLIAILGRGAEVLPIRLWAYTGKFHAEKGELTGLTGPEIERIVSWWGKPGAALEALAKPGIDYLAKAGETYVVPGWVEHNGHIHALKVRGRANAKKRWGQYATSNAASSPNSNAGSNATGNAPAVQPLNGRGLSDLKRPTNSTAPVKVARCRRCFVKPIEAGQHAVCWACSWCSVCEAGVYRIGTTVAQRPLDMEEPVLDAADPQGMMYRCTACRGKTLASMPSPTLTAKVGDATATATTLPDEPEPPYEPEA